MVLKLSIKTSNQKKITLKQLSIDKMKEIASNNTPDFYLPYLLFFIEKTTIDLQKFNFLAEICKPIFDSYLFNDKQKENINEKGLENKNSSLKNVTVALKLLNQAIKNSTIDFESFKQTLVFFDFYQIIEFLKIEQEYIKTISIEILQSSLCIFPDMKSNFREIVANECVEFLTDNRSESGLDLLLEFASSKYFINYDPHINVYYSQFILPTIIKLFSFETEKIYNIVYKYCIYDVNCQKTTLKKILFSYNTISPSFQYKAFIILSSVINANCEKLDSTWILNEVISFISRGLDSEHYIVIDTIYNIFQSKHVIFFMEQNIDLILPSLFSKLYKSSKCFWKQEERFKLLKILDFFLSLDSNLFESCLIEYNYNKKKAKEM